MTFQAVARRHRCPDCTGRIQSREVHVAGRHGSGTGPLKGLLRLEAPNLRSRDTGSGHGRGNEPERRESGARRSVVPSLIVAAFVLTLAALEGFVPRLAAWVASWL